MKPKRIENWERIRQKGPWRYGLIYGTIWGVFVVLFVWIVDQFFLKQDKIMSNLITWLILYIVTGILLYRFIMWNINEKYYQKWLSNQNNS